MVCSNSLLKNFQLSVFQFKYISRFSALYYSSNQVNVSKKSEINLVDFPPSLIRNFCVIAHIDHGKSTFSDRLLEMAGLISSENKVTQYLDKLQVEKERGITVKAQTCSLVFDHNDKKYLLNLIDTPGHVDFTFEVYRSLPACQGAVLLVDATKGVQAQTIAHFNQALLSNMNIIPVINKVDLENADIKSTREQLKSIFSFTQDEIYEISAKSGLGCREVVDAIIEKLSPPEARQEEPLKAFFFDSWFDENEGVTAMVSIIDGVLKVGDVLTPLSGSKSYSVRKVGIFYPEKHETGILYPGQVGFFSANMRDLNEVEIGDVFLHSDTHNMIKTQSEKASEILKNVPAIIRPQPTVFAGIFPCEPNQAKELRKALEKLCLNDASVKIEMDHSPALGQGFRLGFLGLLHMDVFAERLEQEYEAPTVVTTPSVPYRVKIKGAKNIKTLGGEVLTIKNPHHLPSIGIIEKCEEPMVIVSIITPHAFLESINTLFMNRRGNQIDSSYVDQTRTMIRFKIPLSEIVIDLFDILKGMTSGYASFDYEDAGYQENSIVKVDFLLNGNLVDELSTLVPKSRSKEFGKNMCIKIKNALPAQQFDIAIQALINSRIIARENIEALRKDVTAKLYGGDITRAQKLLARQKEGKAKLRLIGKIPVSRQTFIKILRT